MHSEFYMSKPAQLVCKKFAVNLASTGKDLLLKVLKKRIFRNRNSTVSSYTESFQAI
jgi:hypothetical protein